MMPPINRMGMKTAISEILIDMTVKPTSLAPRRAASRGFMPPSIWRMMFSSTTMVSSTTKPVAIVRAIRERLFSEKSARYMTVNVPTSETGTEIAEIAVARPFRRNRNTTRMTRAIEMTSVVSTSESELRMVGVLSMTRFRLIASGIEARNWGMMSLMRSTVSMMLAPGSRKMISMTQGWSPTIPALRRSRTESLTSAMSERRTALPFL